MIGKDNSAISQLPISGGQISWMMPQNDYGGDLGRETRKRACHRHTETNDWRYSLVRASARRHWSILRDEADVEKPERLLLERADELEREFGKQIARSSIRLERKIMTRNAELAAQHLGQLEVAFK